MKTSELTGAALDWAVCKAAGLLDAYPNVAKNFAKLHTKGTTAKYIFPSTDWSQGGPIIEREHIAIFSVETCPFEGEWAAERHKHNQGDCFDDMGGQVVYWFSGGSMRGPTPLIAAMRCFVSSKLGDEIEVPEELL